MILTISHNIFLTKEERYALVQGEEVSVIGVSIPVWIKKSLIPAPPAEMFCEYILKRGEEQSVTSIPTGYKIKTPPEQNNGWLKRISNDSWRKMSEDAKNLWYVKHAKPTTGQLLEFKNGGSDGFLTFNCHDVMQKMNVYHFIEIKPMETLVESLV